MVKWETIRKNPKQLETRSIEELETIKTFGKTPVKKLYASLLSEYESDNEIDEKEIEFLAKLQRAFDLSSTDAHESDVIFPYKIKNIIKKNKTLPVINKDSFNQLNLNFKNDETRYFWTYGSLHEIKSVRVGYQSGSRGMSVYGFRFGNYRGHEIRENQLVPKSSGKLIMTDKRIYYLPDVGQRIITIKISDVMSFNSDEDYVEIFKNGREKAYYFALDLGSIKIIDIGLSFLINS